MKFNYQISLYSLGKLERTGEYEQQFRVSVFARCSLVVKRTVKNTAFLACLLAYVLVLFKGSILFAWTKSIQVY